MNLVLDSVVPVFALIAIGRLLKSLNLTDDAFLRSSDRLVYFIFFPALLFWKIGTPQPGETVDWALIPIVLVAVAITFAASLAYVKRFRVDDFRVGSFSQGCFRFSTYIGLAVIWNSVGESGVRIFGVLIGFVIPVINVLSVAALTWYSNQGGTLGKKTGLMIRELAANPLIIACVSGILYSRLGMPFPRFLENTFNLMSLLALPLALISIGGSLTFHGIRGNAGLGLAAAGLKLIFLPILGYVLMRTLGVSEPAFKVGMIYFALPTSPAIYILSSQLNSDLDLAAATIVLSVLLSIVSLSITLIVFVS